MLMHAPESHIAPERMLSHYLGISRLLAGQMDFKSAIRAVAAEIAHIIPHDHLDVCIVTHGGIYHVPYETGIDTEWGSNPPGLVSSSPIRTLLWGEVPYLITADAPSDPRFMFEGALSKPIIQASLRARIHVPLKVGGEVIGALSCSSHKIGVYSMEDVENARIIGDLLSPYFFALRSAERAQQSASVEAEARAREEGLRQGALKLTEALERERQRIGMDLHDQTLADLTRLSRKVEQLVQKSDLSGDALLPLSRSLQHCMQDLRQIIEEAKPSVLQLFGLAEAVENHLDRSVRDSDVPITHDLTDLTYGIIDKLEPTVSVALFRITQEAINNAVRHAQSSHISVKLQVQASEIIIDVEDNGIGMPKPTRRIGGGINNMKTRARLISAKFSIGSGASQRGTLVSVYMPVPKPLAETTGNIA